MYTVWTKVDVSIDNKIRNNNLGNNNETMDVFMCD